MCISSCSTPALLPKSWNQSERDLKRWLPPLMYPLPLILPPSSSPSFHALSSPFSFPLTSPCCNNKNPGQKPQNLHRSLEHREPRNGSRKGSASRSRAPRTSVAKCREKTRSRNMANREIYCESMARARVREILQRRFVYCLACMRRGKRIRKK